MRVNFFDLGLHSKAWELHHFYTYMFPKLGVDDYRIWGFEAFPEYAKQVEERYAKEDKIKIIAKAVSNNNEDINLYISSDVLGHSIFATKHNVDANKHITVPSIVFSEFLEEECPNFKDEVNVLKCNIEGAEWRLFEDLVGKNYHKHFLIIGAGHDVRKISELNYRDYCKFLSKNGIVIHRFSGDRIKENADVEGLLRKYIDEKKSTGV